MEFLGAVGGWFTTNWTATEAVARNLAVDLAAAWVLVQGFIKVVRPFLPKVADKASALVELE